MKWIKLHCKQQCNLWDIIIKCQSYHSSLYFGQDNGAHKFKNSIIKL